MEITKDIRYVGVNDHQLDLFEGHFIVPNGMAYNSYAIIDEKIAVMDSVERHFGEEWLANLAAVLGERKPDYLIVQHMEPDHSANIATFMDRYPEAVVVASAMAFTSGKRRNSSSDTMFTRASVHWADKRDITSSRKGSPENCSEHSASGYSSYMRSVRAAAF